MVRIRLLFMILMLMGIDSFATNKLVSFFSGRPTIQNIKNDWYDTFSSVSLHRVRKKLTRKKLEKRTIFTKKSVKAYQSALFVEPDEKKAAYIIYYYNEKDNVCTICTLYSKEEVRKHGFGSYLILKCIEHMKQKQMKKILLQACPFEKITDANELKKLIQFYKKFGFKVLNNELIGVTMELTL